VVEGANVLHHVKGGGIVREGEMLGEYMQGDVSKGKCPDS